MDIETLKEEIARLKELTKEKEEALYKAQQKLIAEDNAAMASILEATPHPLICSFCGVTLTRPPIVGTNHMGCYNTGYWAKGFRTHNDWVRACIRNGSTVEEFYKKARSEKNLIFKQENGERPDENKV